MESRKMVLMNLLAEEGWRRDVDNGLVDAEGKGERGTNGGRSIEVYTRSCVN